MSNFDYIINPKNNKKIYIFKKEGRALLKKYIKIFYGGSESDLSSSGDEEDDTSSQADDDDSYVMYTDDEDEEEERDRDYSQLTDLEKYKLEIFFSSLTQYDTNYVKGQFGKTEPILPIEDSGEYCKVEAGMCRWVLQQGKTIEDWYNYNVIGDQAIYTSEHILKNADNIIGNPDVQIYWFKHLSEEKILEMLKSLNIQLDILSLKKILDKEIEVVKKKIDDFIKLINVEVTEQTTVDELLSKIIDKVRSSPKILSTDTDTDRERIRAKMIEQYGIGKSDSVEARVKTRQNKLRTHAFKYKAFLSLNFNLYQLKLLQLTKAKIDKIDEILKETKEQTNEEEFKNCSDGRPEHECIHLYGRDYGVEDLANLILKNQEDTEERMRKTNSLIEAPPIALHEDHKLTNKQRIEVLRRRRLSTKVNYSFKLEELENKIRFKTIDDGEYKKYKYSSFCIISPELLTRLDDILRTQTDNQTELENELGIIERDIKDTKETRTILKKDKPPPKEGEGNWKHQIADKIGNPDVVSALQNYLQDKKNNLYRKKIPKEKELADVNKLNIQSEEGSDFIFKIDAGPFSMYFKMGGLHEEDEHIVYVPKIWGDTLSRSPDITGSISLIKPILVKKISLQFFKLASNNKLMDKDKLQEYIEQNYPILQKGSILIPHDDGTEHKIRILKFDPDVDVVKTIQPGVTTKVLLDISQPLDQMRVELFNYLESKFKEIIEEDTKHMTSLNKILNERLIVEEVDKDDEMERRIIQEQEKIKDYVNLYLEMRGYYGDEWKFRKVNILPLNRDMSSMSLATGKSNIREGKRAELRVSNTEKVNIPIPSLDPHHSGFVEKEDITLEKYHDLFMINIERDDRGGSSIRNILSYILTSNNGGPMGLARSYKVLRQLILREYMDLKSDIDSERGKKKIDEFFKENIEKFKKIMTEFQTAIEFNLQKYLNKN